MVNTFDYIVNKYGIKVGKQYIVDIPNMGRNQMAELFAELGLNKGAEIGVELGIYSEVLCKANPELNLSCIDPWSAGAYEPGIDAVDPEQDKYNLRYEETKSRLSPYKATIIRKASLDALDDFEDNSLDFVYIDANHDFPNFINDLHNWSKKVRVGGIISGHDYAPFPYKKHNHVKRALDVYARCYRMVPFFVVGSYEKRPGEIRDTYRSWFWVKENKEDPIESSLDYLQKRYPQIDSNSQEPTLLNHFGRKAGILNMFNDLKFKVGVEVGTERGIYAEQILTKCPGLKLYCIDPWLSYSEAGMTYTQEDFDARYEEAKNRLNRFNCEIIREKSLDAVDRFDDKSLDFVFIDGDHHYEHVLEDIRAWYPKIRPGGVIYGHDYVERDDFGVVQAVREFVEENNISPLLVCHVPYKKRNGRIVGMVDCWMMTK